jgi:5-methylcytosine-specific restriction endonuclease McrA
MAYRDIEKRKLWAREHYAKNPEKTRQVNKNKREKRKCILFEHLGNKCCKCGSTLNLEIDHINPSFKTTRQSILSVGIERALKECDNLQLLCKECHIKKSQAQKKAAYYLFYNMPLEEQEKWIDKFIDHKGFIDRSNSLDDEDTESL